MKWLAALPGELVRSTLLFLAVGCAVTGIMAWVGVFTPKLHFVANLASIGLAGGALSGLVWLAQPRAWRSPSTGPMALIAVVLWGVLIVPDVGARLLDRAAQAQGETLKIVQFNLWYRDYLHTDAKYVWIHKQDPDVVLLQEADDNAFDLLLRLAPSYPYRVDCRTAGYSCSVTLLSKRPPIASGRWNGQYKDAKTPPQPDLVWARFHTEAGDYVVATSHVPWPLPDGRQPRLLAAMAADLKSLKSDDLVLAGDFNATPWAVPLRQFDRDSGLTRRTHFLPTWPGAHVTSQLVPVAFPMLPIDHVYASPAWRTVAIERSPDLGSDHYALVATLVRDKTPKRAKP